MAAPDTVGADVPVTRQEFDLVMQAITVQQDTITNLVTAVSRLTDVVRHHGKRLGFNEDDMPQPAQPTVDLVVPEKKGL